MGVGQYPDQGGAALSADDEAGGKVSRLVVVADDEVAPLLLQNIRSGMMRACRRLYSLAASTPCVRFRIISCRRSLVICFSSISYFSGLRVYI